MAVQYAPTKLRVPAGFQNILEGFAREVLREQPEDIIQFGAQYFRAQLSIRDDTGKDDAKRGEQLENLQKGDDIDIDLGDPEVQAAATKIQAGFRGHKAREDVKHKKEEETAAIKIQSSFRGHKAREDVKELKETRSRESAEVSPSKEAEKPVEDEVDIDLNDPEVQGAALKIQASFRGHKARSEVQKIKSSESVAAEVKDEVEKEETAVTDQPTEDVPNEEEIDIDLNDPQVEKAASIIQSTFRAHKSRESVKLMADQDGAEQEPKEDAVDQVEESGVADQSDAPATDKAEEIDIDLSDPEVNKAASMIQASFRGHKTRQELKDKSPTASRESVKTEEPAAADDVAPETTSEQQSAAEVESEPQEAVETQEAPAETQEAPAETQEAPAETLQATTETQEAPSAETQEAPAETQEAEETPADAVDKAEDAASESVDVAPASVDVAPASVDVAPASVDVTPASVDVAPASIDVAQESVDVAPEAESEPQAETEVEGQEAKPTPDAQESSQQEDDTDKPETVAEASQPTEDKAES